MRSHWHRGQALKATDGQLDGGLHSCTILNNVGTDVPAWFVDLKTPRDINGLIIHTWQGQANFSKFPN